LGDSFGLLPLHSQNEKGVVLYKHLEGSSVEKKIFSKLILPGRKKLYLCAPFVIEGLKKG
jgi:hypothetical protein